MANPGDTSFHRAAGVDRWPRPLAFVLSGGGAFGSVQVGMIRALLDHGIEPDLVVGASVGALNGAVVASKRPEAVDALEETWLAMNRRQLFGGPLSMARSLIRHRALSDSGHLEALIDSQRGPNTFEDLAIPFAAVVTDALTGEAELLQSGELKPALLASSAVPGAFPPVDIGGRQYVDGGVVANVPIRQAIAFGARSVISLDATPPTMSQELPGSLIGRILHSASLMLRAQRAHAVEDLASRYHIVSLPNPIPPDMGTFNFSLTRQLLDESYQMAAAAIDSWGDAGIDVDIGFDTVNQLDLDR